MTDLSLVSDKFICKSPSIFYMVEKGIPNRLVVNGLPDLSVRLREKVEPVILNWLSCFSYNKRQKSSENILVIGNGGDVLIPLIADAVYRRGFKFACVSQLEMEDVFDNDSLMVNQQTLKDCSVLLMHKFVNSNIKDWKCWSLTKKILFHRFDECRPTVLFTTMDLDEIEKMAPVEIVDLLSQQYTVLDLRGSL